MVLKWTVMSHGKNKHLHATLKSENSQFYKALNCA